MKYLSAVDIITLHDLVIESTSGKHGIIDIFLIDSAVKRPKATFDKKELYVSILEKASALMHSLIFNHVFVDGNKRTALLATIVFLELNGYRLEIDQIELEKFILKVVNEKWSILQIKNFLEIIVLRK